MVQQNSFLGIEINCSLEWKEQIRAVSKKVSRALYFLKHAKSFSSRDFLKTLNRGIVEPHFQYFCSAWVCAGSSDFNQLQKLQR